jgi:hypothetical protein
MNTIHYTNRKQRLSVWVLSLTMVIEELLTMLSEVRISDIHRYTSYFRPDGNESMPSLP